jgi:cytidine kinase
MSLLVVGSFGIDTVQTPTETREDVIGGSAVYFSYAASYFGPVKVVGAVGDDWPTQCTELLQNRAVDTSGVEVRKGGKTFRWTGKYMDNMNDRETLDIHLNVLGDFEPKLSDAARESKYVFLANGGVDMQLSVLDQCPNAKMRVADTMDLWITTQREKLLELLKRIDGLVLNDSEAILLTGDKNVVRSGKKILDMGPRFVVIKRGEHGAMFVSADHIFVLPAYPTADVIDPTGAGDSFAGGMMGHLAANDLDADPDSMKTALAYGTVTASFNVEGFSLERFLQIEREDLEARMAEYRNMLTLP